MIALLLLEDMPAKAADCVNVSVSFPGLGRTEL